MKRRDFLVGLSTMAPVASALGLAVPKLGGAATALDSEGWRSFDITTAVNVAAPAGRTLLWLPVPLNDAPNFQRVLAMSWEAPGSSRAELRTVSDYGVRLLYVEWADPKAVGPVTLRCRVATRDRGSDLSARGTASQPYPDGLQRFLRPTALLPTDGIVRQTAESIVGTRRDDLEKAHAIYEWVVDHTNRDPTTPGCGLGDVASMLKSGYLGGKCADINALFVALARAVNIPARDLYGVRLAASRRGFSCLGRDGDISKAQHCRAEFYAADIGWVPVDPADVRKVVLEEVPGGLSMQAAKVQAARSMLFGSWEMNWVAYNYGHDVALPGSAHRPLPFLMYPNAETAEGRLDSLDPVTFRYQIVAQEIAGA